MTSNLRVLPKPVAFAMLDKVTMAVVGYSGTVTGILHTTGGVEYKVRYFDAHGQLQEVWFLPSEIECSNGK